MKRKENSQRTPRMIRKSQTTLMTIYPREKPRPHMDPIDLCYGEGSGDHLQLHTGTLRTGYRIKLCDGYVAP